MSNIISQVQTMSLLEIDNKVPSFKHGEAIGLLAIVSLFKDSSAPSYAKDSALPNKHTQQTNRIKLLQW